MQTLAQIGPPMLKVAASFGFFTWVSGGALPNNCCADQPIIGVDIRDIAVDEFRVGMRLRAEWKSPAERDVSDLGNRYGGAWEGVIDRWEPTGEPDVDPRSLEHFAF